MLDEKAIIFKVQNLSGKSRRRCDGHKRESRCALPGEACWSVLRIAELQKPRGRWMDQQGSAEAS